jgi:Ser/Thr protein kinase RdoA (MazF antagonist)
MTTSAVRGTSMSFDLEEVLSGRLGAGAVRQVAVEPLRHGLLDLLRECDPLGRVVSLELVRTKYKPGRKLTGYYRVRTEATAQPRHIAMTWSAEQPTAVPAPDQSMTREEREVAEPFARLAARSSDGGTDLLVSPADPALPQLTRLSHRGQLAELLTQLCGRPLGPPGELSIRPVRYRPRQRHVLHVAGGRLGPSGIYVKTDRDDSGARAVPVATELGETLAARCPGARIAEPVGYAAAEHAAVWRGAPGRPLGERLRDGSDAGVRLVHLTGRALRVLHGAEAPVTGTRSVLTEAAETLRAGEHLTALVPPLGDSYRNLVAGVVAALDRWPAEAPSVVHGDVKCDNLLTLGHQEVRLLDLDRVSHADPALDLGKFLADLQWWCPSPQLPALREALRDGYGSCDPARWARAELLAVLFRAKLLARRCAVHDPRWTSQVRTRLAGAEAALETGQADR